MADAPNDTILTTGLTAEQLQSARASWASYGLDPSKFDAGMGLASPPSPTVPQPSPSSPTPDLNHQLNDRELRMAIDNLSRAGVSREDIDAALKADGYQAIPHDTRSPELREYDRDFGIEARDPSDYSFDFKEVGRGWSLDTLIATNKEAQEFAAATFMPPPLAQGLVAHAIEVMQRLGSMNQTQLAAWQAEQEANWSNYFKDADAKSFMEDIDQLFEGAGQPAFAKALWASGALHDGWLLRSLGNWAQQVRTWAATRRE